MRIVVVEDEIRIREGIVRLIKKLNPEYDIAGEAENGRQGLKMVLELDPDVVITDIRMAEMDGLEMLRALSEKGSRSKAIVLSAYSEFEYARQAISLGVKEYLLKPIIVNDISEALERISGQIENERKPGLINNTVQLFSGILWGSLTVDEKLKESVYKRFAVGRDTAFIEIALYIGDKYESSRLKAGRQIEEALREKTDVSYCLLESERERVILVLIYQYQNLRQLERFIQIWMLNHRRMVDADIAMGWIGNLKLEELKSGFETLLQYMDWNISLGDEVMISYPKIMNLQTSPCIYPIEIENQMKQAICGGHMERIGECMERFHLYFRNGRVFAPKEIKECYVRFLWAVMNTAKEVGILNYKNLEQQKLLEKVMGAKTTGELMGAAGYLEQQLKPEESEDITHITVKRAQQMIQEFYASGITLDEIAGKLNLTPEYLGTQFHKAAGVNFSTYIKNYRIKKAKELLIGTQLKLYEIAEKVGYSDAKYFSRVFKDCTGQLPAEYRRTRR